MFKPSAILLNNPNFVVSVNPSDGTVLQLMALIWDFTKQSADTFTYDPISSLEAFTRLNRKAQAQTIPCEIYHLDLAIQKDWLQASVEAYGTSEHAQTCQDARLKTIDPNFAGATLGSNIRIDKNGLTPTKIWMTIDVSGQRHVEVFAATLNVCKGARMACRFTGDGYPNSRQVVEVHAVDLIVEAEKEPIQQGIAKMPIKHRIAVDESEFIEACAPATHPYAKSASDHGRDIEVSMPGGYRERHILGAFPRVLIPTDTDEDGYKQMGYDRLETYRHLITGIRGDNVQSVAAMAFDWPHSAAVEIPISHQYTRAAVDFISQTMTTIDEGGVTISDAVSKKLVEHLALGNAWDRPKHTLYVLATYGTVGMFDSAFKKAHCDLVDAYNVVLVPFSNVNEDEIILIISPPELPFAIYSEILDGEMAYRRFIQVTELVWRFRLVDQDYEGDES